MDMDVPTTAPTVLTLLIKVRKDEQTHCGYCSDSYGHKTVVSTKKQCLHDIPPSLIDENDEDVRNFIRSRINLKAEPCTYGSGYCGCVTSYRVLSYKFRQVVEFSPKWPRR